MPLLVILRVLLQYTPVASVIGMIVFRDQRLDRYIATSLIWPDCHGIPRVRISMEVVCILRVTPLGGRAGNDFSQEWS